MLENITPHNMRILFGLTLGPIGLAGLVTGMLLLIFDPVRKEAKKLVAQSAHLGSLRPLGDKALTDGLNQLTQSATALVGSLTELLKTSSGNAIAVLIVSGICLALSYWMLVLINN